MTERELSFFIFFLGSFFLFESSAFPQESPQKPPSKEELAKNNKLLSNSRRRHCTGMRGPREANVLHGTGGIPFQVKICSMLCGAGVMVGDAR